MIFINFDHLPIMIYAIKDNKSNFIIISIMGCASTVVVEQRRILSLPPETVNSYIDKFPAITLQKIKQKFFNLSDKQTKDLSYFNFLKLYSVCKLNSEVVIRLFQFFNDHRRQNLKFKHFMSKYAIITKGESQIIYKILFEIYKNNEEIDIMTAEQFQNFARMEQKFMTRTPSINQPTITQQNFVQLIEKAGFNVIEFQNQLLITNEEDIPFQTINRQLQECDFNDFVKDNWYYLLSNAWYNRWSFYYQEINHSIDRTHIKSTKMLLTENNVNSIRRRKKRQNLNDSKRTNQSFIRSSQIGTALIQQPNTINFDDIEGQYKGQLKQSLKTSTQIKVITENLWHLLCSLHPPEQQFKRIALNEDTIEYYPKSIYYCQADRSGQIILESQSIKQLSMAKPVLSLFPRYQQLTKKQKFGVFSKNFYQKNWREIGITKIGTDISLDPRYFVAFAEDREKFIENNYRKQITVKNIDVGDKVFAYFPYVKTHSQAVILSKSENEKFKLHFKGFSYKYQIQVVREDISIAQSDAAISSSKKKNQTLIKGIPNIGNTCFMNAVIQSLVATPVLDQFLISFPFDEKKHPVGYGLSLIAKSLMKNQKPFPQTFKKLIDIHMPLFSGFDQHDAQQFLNILLDKISEEIADKPTVIDYLFGGKAQSKLTCSACRKVKLISQNMYILSLPLPEAEYNVYSVIVVSSNSSSMKKIIFKLHKDSTISDYLNIFEEKTGQNKKDFIFCELTNNSLKKIKNQLLHPSYQKKKITDMGIVPNISLVAYERIPIKWYYELLRVKKQHHFRDYKTSQAYWTVCKIGGKTDAKDKISLQYLNQQNEFQKIKIDKNSIDKCTQNLGSQTTENLFRKMILRKYNPSLKKLQFFGTQFLIGIPRWASYNDLILLVQKYIINLKTKQAKLSTKSEKGDYLIRLLDPSKVKCIFCSKQTQMFNIDQSDLQYCCDAFDKDIPLAWASKGKSYWIYIDWINFQNCNSSYCMYLQVDPVSKNVQLSRQQEQINLQDCIKLYNEPQTVQMECDFCKEKYQKLEHLIGSMPNILVVHMKEFRYTPQGHLIKLDLRLKWQEILDSSKFALSTQGKLYQLFAVVRHSGTGQSGHYTCVAKRKHPFENKKVWINFDDDMADIVKQQQKFIDDAYLLFYKKVDMPTSALVIYSDLNSK